MPASLPIYAHSLPDTFEQAAWVELEAHQGNVTVQAEQFAGIFGAGSWGRLAGAWHDLGKLQPQFQEYIRGLRSEGPPHAWVGAMVAATVSSKRLLPLAFAIAAHHCGLADFRRDSTLAGTGPLPLRDLIEQRKGEFSLLMPMLPPRILDTAIIDFPSFVVDAVRLEMFTRLLFSALVDADRLATTGFYARHIPALTADQLRYDGIPALRARLDRAIDNMPPKGAPAVITLRRHVLDACRKRADDAPNRFSLTVPTGGGKTLSAMSFALRHAELEFPLLGVGRACDDEINRAVFKARDEVFRPPVDDPI